MEVSPSDMEGCTTQKETEMEMKNITSLQFFLKTFFVEVPRRVYKDVSRDGLSSACIYSADILPCEEGLVADKLPVLFLKSPKHFLTIFATCTLLFPQ